MEGGGVSGREREKIRKGERKKGKKRRHEQGIDGGQGGTMKGTKEVFLIQQLQTIL